VKNYFIYKVKVSGSAWSLMDVSQALVSLTSTLSNCFSNF